MDQDNLHFLPWVLDYFMDQDLYLGGDIKVIINQIPETNARNLQRNYITIQGMPTNKSSYKCYRN